jgi:hypothetical protein
LSDAGWFIPHYNPNTNKLISFLFKPLSEDMRSEFSDNLVLLVVALEDIIVGLVEERLIDLVTSEDFEVVRHIGDLNIGLSDFSFFTQVLLRINEYGDKPNWAISG